MSPDGFRNCFNSEKVRREVKLNRPTNVFCSLLVMRAVYPAYSSNEKKSICGKKIIFFYHVDGLKDKMVF